MEALHLIPVSIVRCFKKLDMNNLSWSETMSEGRLFLQYQLSKNKTASSGALSEVEVGIIQISEPRRSVIVRIQLKP